jgi:para-nitrobenzyl esterase
MLGLLLFGAAFASDQTAETASGLTGVTWQLEQVEGVDGMTAAIDQPDRYTVTFDDDGRVYLRADCNQGMGSYELDGNELRLLTLASTLALCPPGSLYDAFMAQLNDVMAWELQDGTLALSTSGSARLLFAAADRPESEEDAGSTSSGRTP